MRQTLYTLALGLALLSAAAGARAGDIVDAAYVADALKRGAIVWDVRSAGDYAKGHIAGAVNADSVWELRTANTEDYIPTARIQDILNAAGIDLSREIITTSRTGDPGAYFGLLTLRHFGAKNAKVFHGGLDAWQAAGLPVTKEPTRLAPVAQTLQADPTVHIYMKDVLTRVGNGSVQFVDARTPKEFSGDDIRALRGGHIPGAKNIPYEQNWVDPATAAKLTRGEVKTRDGMALKSPEQLRALYAGLDPDKETVVYCQSGSRASQTAAVLRDLGFKNVRVFEESWLGYGNTLSAPAESVQFLNVAALNNRIKSLESEVEGLTAEIKALKEAKK